MVGAFYTRSGRFVDVSLWWGGKLGKEAWIGLLTLPANPPEGINSPKEHSGFHDFIENSFEHSCSE